MYIFFLLEANVHVSTSVRGTLTVTPSSDWIATVSSQYYEFFLNITLFSIQSWRIQCYLLQDLSSWSFECIQVYLCRDEYTSLLEYTSVCLSLPVPTQVCLCLLEFTCVCLSVPPPAWVRVYSQASMSLYLRRSVPTRISLNALVYLSIFESTCFYPNLPISYLCLLRLTYRHLRRLSSTY